MFYPDHREKNISEMRGRIPKGIDTKNIKVGDLIYLSSNLSTGDRSFCNVLIEVEAINPQKTHASIRFKSRYLNDEERREIAFLPEYEVYAAEA